MNYLAHLLLAGPSEDARLGGMIGDFMRGLAVEDFAPGIRDGIALHREIDRRTDAHPVFRRSWARLPAALRRFGAVIIDVGFDHFLAAEFSTWHPTQSLGVFAAEVYELLNRRSRELPPRLARARHWIVGQDWLTSYADLDHLTPVFRGMARRVRRSDPLLEAAAAIRCHYDALAGDFAEFFPELRAAVQCRDAVNL